MIQELLQQVRHAPGTSEEAADDLVLAAMKRLKATSALSEKDLGNAALKRGDVAAAYSHYSEAIRLAPDKASARSSSS
jgi:Flp pilus assembly protein TadD